MNFTEISWQTKTNDDEKIEIFLVKSRRRTLYPPGLAHIFLPDLGIGQDDLITGEESDRRYN